MFSCWLFGQYCHNAADVDGKSGSAGIHVLGYVPGNCDDGFGCDGCWIASRNAFYESECKLKLPRLLTLTICVATLAIPAWSSQFETFGKAVYVPDGDTIVLLIAGNQQLNIRLSSIDAPESSHTKKQAGRVGQPYSDNSKQYLSALIKNKTVQAHCFEQDFYGRTVCELFVDSRSVNQEMVRAGFAWANMSAHGRYLRDKSLPALESQARSSHAGLWAGRNPVAPWDWRDVCWKQGRCVQ